MKLLKWFYPGMKIKRWIALAMFGVIMLSYTLVVIITDENGKMSGRSAIIFLLAIMVIIIGVKRIINSLITIFLPQSAGRELVDIVYNRRQLEKGYRIVVIGGGSGLSVILHGLKEYTNNLTAVVTVADEGGFADDIQSQFGLPHTTDVRNSLIALSDAEPVTGRLFNYRFKKGTELWGHNFGDLFLTAMSEIAGDFDKAVKESSRVLAIRGRVILSTFSKVSLIAQHEDGSETVGKQDMLNSSSPINKVYLRPHSVRATVEALDAIARADAIVIGPGNLYTSIMPSLLIEEIAKALTDSRAVKIYVANIMTKPGETDNYKLSNHLIAINEHVGSGLFSHCIVNKEPIPKEQLKNYEQEGATEVFADREEAERLGCKTVGDSIIDKNTKLIRHDPLKVAAMVTDLITVSKRTRPHAKQ